MPLAVLTTPTEGKIELNPGVRKTEQGSTCASFFRLERVLSPLPPELAAAWMASYTTSLRTRLLRVGGAMLAAPARAAQVDPTQTARITWMGLEGMSRDRIETLAPEFARDRIVPKLSERALSLVKAAKKRGDRVVLISSSIAPIADTVGKELGADLVVSNRLEYREERTTGRLKDPVMHGTAAARWIKDWAQENDIALDKSSAFGGLAEDVAMLASVGKPCAVRPDRALRANATTLDWPVVL